MLNPLLFKQNNKVNVLSAIWLYSFGALVFNY